MWSLQCFWTLQMESMACEQWGHSNLPISMFHSSWKVWPRIYIVNDRNHIVLNKEIPRHVTSQWRPCLFFLCSFKETWFLHLVVQLRWSQSCSVRTWSVNKAWVLYHTLQLLKLQVNLVSDLLNIIWVWLIMMQWSHTSVTAMKWGWLWVCQRAPYELYLLNDQTTERIKRMML